MRIFGYFIIVFQFFVCCVQAEVTGKITYLNRWPATAPNVITKVGNYVYYGDGEAIAVYDAKSLTPVARVGIRLTDGDSLENGHASGSEGISGLFYSNGYLYAACGNEGLQIFDLPENPADFGPNNFRGKYIVKKEDARANVRDVAVTGNYAYIGYHWLSDAGYDSGIQAVDVSDPVSPFLAGEAELPQSFAEIKKVQSIAVAGGYAYAADIYNGLAIFDLSQPTKPQLEAACYMPSALDVSVSGNYAYVACAGYGLRVVNVNPDSFTDNLDSLSVVATSQYDGGTTKTVSVEASGNYAYIGDVDLGMLVVDISSPENVYEGSVIGQYYDALGAYRISFDEESRAVYVGDCRKGLQKIDVFTAASPSLIVALDNTATPADADAVWVDADTSYVYTVDNDATSGNIKEGLRIFFAILSDEYVSFLLKGMLPTDGEASDVYVSGGYVYVADGSGGLKIIDPGLPAVDAEGDRATENPVNPVLIGSCGVPGGPANGVFVEGGFAYVAAGTGGLKVIDVSDLTAPVEVGQLAGTSLSDAQKVAVVGNFAYVADGRNGLKVVDVADRSQPVLMGGYYIPDSDDLDVLPGYAHDVSLIGILAYVAAGNEGFQVIDVSDPSSPAYYSRYHAEPYYDVKGIYTASSDVNEKVNLIWVANGVMPDENFCFFTDPPTVPPQRHVGYHSSGDVRDVVVVGNFAYIAESAGGFQVLMVDEGEAAETGDWYDDVKPVNLHSNSHDSSSCFIGTLLDIFW